MAENYVQFAERIDNLTDEEMDWFRACFEWEPPEDPPEDYEPPPWIDIETDGLNFDYTLNRAERYVHFYSETDGNLDTLEALVRAFLVKFRPDYVFSISWAETCSKPRAGEFGGGAMVITKDKTEWVSTWEFIRKTRAALEAEI